MLNVNPAGCPRRATHILTAVNVLRRRLRDRDEQAYREELAFYANDIGMAENDLNAMARLEMQPVRF
jgi:NADH:ubiquinone oxidoreductase subunit B-like Fe-S oxidoreductase